MFESDQEPLCGGEPNAGKDYNLPRDVYRSYWSYWLTKHKITAVIGMLGVSATTAVCYGCRKQEDAAVIYAAVSLFGTFLLVCFMLASYACESVALKTPEKMIFLVEIGKAGPGLDIKVWDAVAASVNGTFFEQGIFSSPDYFYDGQACYQRFKRDFLTNDASPAKPSNAPECGATGGPAGGPTLRDASSADNTELQGLIDTVVEQHCAKVTQCWEQALAQVPPRQS
ncbi:LAMI_0H11298g1_1 [Lachancea mirantina]|uniref:LAMI_0H11298g1_1 n=1 Tax=Lachancea mirantina TaxID=1230905 RepID=A0A1G4KGY5_9SACH|nr:LAMI_0H11298g1_1 [Lachancea mirantina]